MYGCVTKLSKMGEKLDLQNIPTIVGVLTALLAIPKAVAGLVPPSGNRRRLDLWNEVLDSPLMEQGRKEKVLFQRNQRLAVLYAKHWAGPARRAIRTMEVVLCIFIFGASFAISFLKNGTIAMAAGLVMLEIFWILGMMVFSSISIKVQQNEARKRFQNGKMVNPSPNPRAMQERVGKLQTVDKYFTWLEATLEGLPIMFAGLFLGSMCNMIAARDNGDPLFLIATWLGFTLSFIMNVFLGKSFLLARYEKMLISDIRAAARASRKLASSI